MQITRRSLVKIDRRNERMIYLVVGADSDAERIPVYNQLLGNTSPRFKKLVESMSPGSVDLEILGISKKIMSILIEYIYQTFEDGKASLPITDANVHEFFFAANKFELTDVQSLCQDYLECMEIKEQNCIQLFVKTPESTSANFKRKCLEFMLSSLSHLLTTNAFVNLTMKQLVSIIRDGRTEFKCSEDLLCQAAVNWLQYRSNERSKRVTELIVEFPGKEHKLQVIQAIHEIPNPELQKFAFELISDLYISGSKTVPTATNLTMQTDNAVRMLPSQENCGQSNGNKNNILSKKTTNFDHNITSNNITITIDKCDVAAYISPLKRDKNPALDILQDSSCSQPKRHKSQSGGSDEKSTSTPTPTSTLPESSNRPGENGSTVTSNNICSVSRIGGGSSSSFKGSTVYFVARLRGFNNLYSLNLQTYDVKLVPTVFPRILANLESTSMQYYQGQIYFMGGRTTNYLSNNESYIFNLEKKSWTMKKMLQSRYGIQSVRFHSWMFAFGGRKNNEMGRSGNIDSVERLYLDTVDEDWVEVEEKPLRPRHSCAIVSFKNRIYTIGGFTMEENTMIPSGVCELFNPQWARPMPWKVLKATLCFPRYDLSAVATETAIYAIGGRTKDQKKLRTVEILREDSGVWEVGPDLIKPRAYASSVYCGEQNAIFVFGGDSDGDPTIEKLDLMRKTWSLVCVKSFPGYKNYFSVAFQPCENFIVL